MRKYLQKKILLFSFFLLVGAVLRFSYLDWGSPFFFHPDENNIATAINQMSFSQLNPHFFAYGGLPIYVTFLISSLITFGHLQFGTIIYTLRFISATLSFFLVISLFLVGRKFYNTSTGILAAILGSFSVGLIQFAHFGTFEMWLSIFTLWFAYSCYLFYKEHTKKNFFLVSVLGGILLSIKISSLVFIPIPILLFFIIFLQKKISFLKLLRTSLVYMLIASAIFAITNPFIFFDTTNAINSLHYESSVALGTLPVFYTQSFLHTTPLLYQLQYVFPFLLNPFVEIAVLMSSVILFAYQFKKRHMQDGLLLIFLLLILASQATVFVKWTRYMVPTLPFLYLILARTLILTTKKRMFRILSTILISISIIYGLSFFFTVYPEDSRFAANLFAQKHIENQAAITEPYDLGSMPFSTTFPNSQIINLYEIDNDLVMQHQLQIALDQNPIFLSPSQRLWSVRLKNENDFPYAHDFYKKLFNGALGYKIIYQTPCNFWCALLYMGNPAQNVEATANVFDRPIVTIFQHE